MDWHDLGINTHGHTSGQIKTQCPKCNPTSGHPGRKDLSVNLDERVYQCHNDGCDFTGKLPGGTSERIRPVQTFARPVTPEDARLDARAQALLTQRKINLAVALEAGLYTDGDWLAFPYTRDGQTVHIKYRGLDGKRFRCEEGTEHIAYGLDWCAEADTVVVCEGEFDALALRTAGFTAVLSVPDGAKSGAGPAFVASTRLIFERAKRVVLATDGDEPGTALADGLVPFIGARKVARVQWPEGTKDANDVLVRQGPDALKALIQSAPWEPVPGLVPAATLADDFLAMHRNEIDHGYESGMEWFDQYYRVGLGQLTIVTGLSYHGKTTFLDFLLLQYMKKHNWHIGIFSPEQYPNARHAAVLATQLLGKPMPVPWRTTQTKPMTGEEAADAIAWINRHVTFIDPEDPTVDSLLDLAAAVIDRTGAKGIVLDPWNEIAHERTTMSETLYTGEVLRRLKTFARHHNIHLWLVAHPTKLPRGEDGKEPIPHLDNISGSANFRNKADMGLIVWRDTSDNEHQNLVTVRIDKAKHRAFGREGDLQFGYEPESMRFYELARPVRAQKGF